MAWDAAARQAGGPDSNGLAVTTVIPAAPVHVQVDDGDRRHRRVNAGNGRAARETDALLPRGRHDSAGTLESGSGSGTPSSGTPSHHAPPRQSIGPRRAVALALSLWALIFLQASNISGMTMAQSTIAADLDAYGSAMWFTSAYLIATASFAPLVGRLATIFPPRNLSLLSALLFALGAAWTAAARSLSVFLWGRVISGLGGAGVMTLSLITVLQLADGRRRGTFVGLVNAGFTAGMSTGAIVYGAVLPVFGWRTLFLVQTPLSVVSGLGVFLAMPHFERDPDAKSHDHFTVWQKLARIDYIGATLLTLAIVLFLYGLSGTIQPIPMYVSVVTLALFVAAETWLVPDGGEPIVPLELLRSRGVLLSCLAQLSVMAARWAVLYYSPIFMLAVRGAGAATAGSVLIPTNAGFGIGGLIIGWLHIRRAGAFWLPSTLSVAVFSASLALVGICSRAGDAFQPGAYVLALFANGFCTGAFLNYTLAHLLHLTRPSTHFVSSSLLATFRGFSGSFGTSIGGGFFIRRLSAQLTDGLAALDGGVLSDEHAALIPRLIGSPALVYGNDDQGHPVLTAAQRAVAVAGYESTLGTLYRVSAIVSLFVLLIQAGTGWTEPTSWPEASGVANGYGAVEGDEEEEIVDEEEIREAIAEHDGIMEA